MKDWLEGAGGGLDWAEGAVDLSNRKGTNMSDAWKDPTPEMLEWFPISTAPKDGTMFLGLWPECVQYHDQIKVSYWNKRANRFDDVDDSGQEHPSHWMPLPSPPLSPTETGV